MKCSAAGSTEIGFLVLFWPELLPADFDERDLSHPDELANCIDGLQAAGKLIWFPDVPNGDHTLGLFVDEAPPEELQNYCTLSLKMESLQVAGDGWFGGLEAIFRADRSYLDRRPRKCSAVQIPAGEYLAELFVTEVPAAVYEDWIRREAGESAQRWWWVQTWFAAVGVVAAMVCVGCLFLAAQEIILATFAGSAMLLLIAWLMSLSPGYQRVQQARREYAAAYPNFVVRLRKEPRKK
jgi:hypothetical protein